MLRSLEDLKSLGVSLGIDDFGTGHASLNHLRHLPVDYVKVDHRFIHCLGDSGEDEAIVRAVMGLGPPLGFTTIVEGVETAEQLQFLRGIKCDLAQGHYFTPATPPEELEDLIGRSMRW